MTMFDERERAFENLFAHEEEVRFRALARRNQLFAGWAAEQIGLRGSEYRAYVRSFTDAVTRLESEEVLLERVRADLLAAGVDSSAEHMLRAMLMATAQAARQVRPEARHEMT